MAYLDDEGDVRHRGGQSRLGSCPCLPSVEGTGPSESRDETGQNVPSSNTFDVVDSVSQRHYRRPVADGIGPEVQIGSFRQNIIIDSAGSVAAIAPHSECINPIPLYDFASERPPEVSASLLVDSPENPAVSAYRRRR